MILSGNLFLQISLTKWILFYPDVESTFCLFLTEASSFSDVPWILNSYQQGFCIKKQLALNCPIISLTWIKYKRGPRIYPWGTPQVNSLAPYTISLTWPIIIYTSNTLITTLLIYPFGLNILSKWTKLHCLLYQKPWVDLTGPLQCNCLCCLPSLYHYKQGQCNVPSWTRLWTYSLSWLAVMFKTFNNSDHYIQS